MQRLFLVALSLAAGCGGLAPLGVPCVTPLETAQPTIALGSAGGTFVYGSEGLPSGLFVHRFDATDTLTWTATLPPPGAHGLRRFAVAGDSAFFFDDDSEQVTILRDGAITFAGSQRPDCNAGTFAADGDRLRVFGSSGQPSHFCTYELSGDGTSDSLVTFDADTPFSVGSAASGGFLVVAQAGLIRYDAGGNRLWTHAGTFVSDALEAGGSVYGFTYTASNVTLVRIGLDGQGEDQVRSWDHDANNASDSELKIVGLLPTSDGIIVAVEQVYSYKKELLRVDAAGVRWVSTLDPLATNPLLGVELGSQLLILHDEAELLAFDVDGNQRWQKAAPIDAAIGSDDRPHVADTKALDECRDVLRVSTLDATGAVQSTWSAR